MADVKREWFDDLGEVLAFGRWYFDGSHVSTADIFYYFEKPWKWNDEYAGYKKEVVADAN